MRKLALITFVAFFFFAGIANATETEKNALIHESIETELEIEDWMTNESVWNMRQTSAIGITEEFESELEIESWMVNSELWEANVLSDDGEEELIVECWMTNEKLWNP